MPKKITLPPDDGDIYRGDDWAVKVRFHRDISGAVFACQLRHSRWATPIDAIIDPTHQSDPLDSQDPTNDPYIVLTLPGAVTATIDEDLLEGDLQDSPTHTVFKFVVPVKGQDTVSSA